MPTNKRSGWVLVMLTCLIWIALAGCTASLTPSGKIATLKHPPPGEILVAAASNLQFALPEITHLYEQDTGHVVRLVFGSSGQLTQQIENGAPYDLFLAANQEYVERLVRQELATQESMLVYARGRLVLASNRQAGLELQQLEDLLDPSIHHIAIANPEHAPYGQAAQQALQSAGLWEKVKDRLVLAENVRQALQYLQSGDAQTGLIPLSEANQPEISWVLVDEELHEPLDQYLAVLTSSHEPQLAMQFVSYLTGDKGRAVMHRYGFLLPGDPLVQAGPDTPTNAQP